MTRTASFHLDLNNAITSDQAAVVDGYPSGLSGGKISKLDQVELIREDRER